MAIHQLDSRTRASPSDRAIHRHLRSLRTSFSCIAVACAFFPFAGCETIVYWQDLPPSSTPRVVWVKGDNPAIVRAAALTKKLVDVKPLAASIIFVMTNEYRFTSQKLPRIPELAHSARCSPLGEEKKDGVPPSGGCIWLPGASVDRLSDEALAAVIAHELGHIEKGHRTWSGAAEPTLAQWEADEAAADRLNRAGYCAGEAMRKYAAELVSAYAGRLVHPWRDYPVDCPVKSTAH